jgi:DNA (cytosine-5)-methyltransferase 1
MADDRNQLFVEYVKVLSLLKPEGFVFENVLGLLNMEGGRVFEIVRSSLLSQCTELVDWVLSTENHAIPQRRKRIILIGSATGARPVPPPALSRPPAGALVPLREFVTVGDAISDLPPLEPGQDGSDLNYLGAPATAFQSLMRGFTSVDDYVAEYSPSIAIVN